MNTDLPVNNEAKQNYRILLRNLREKEENNCNEKINDRKTDCNQPK